MNDYSTTAVTKTLFDNMQIPKMTNILFVMLVITLQSPLLALDFVDRSINIEKLGHIT